MTSKEGGLFASAAGDYGAGLYSTGYGKPLQNSKDWLYYAHQGSPENSTGCIYYGPNGIYRGFGGAGTDDFRSDPIILNNLSGDIELRVSGDDFIKTWRGGEVRYVTTATTGSIGNPSSKTIKTNIQDVDFNQINSFLEEVEPKTFYNLLEKKNQLFIVIENEEEHENPFSDILFELEHAGNFTEEEIPEYLQQYKNTEILQKEGDSYKWMLKTVNINTLIGIILSSTKYNHNRIKTLEERISLLEKKLEEK